MGRITNGTQVSLLIAFVTLAPTWAVAQDANAMPTYRLKAGYVKELARQNSLRFALPVRLSHRTASVHPAASDCEMHLAGTSGLKIGFPGKVIVEPPNLCAFDPPATVGATWGAVFDEHVLGQACTAIGFPRLYAEHLENGTSPANPPHMVEIHPVMDLTCGTTTLDFTNMLTIVDNMARIKDESASQCLAGYKLWVRRDAAKSEYQFLEERPGRCGNFAVVEALIDHRYVRSVSGGHSALAQVWAGEEGPYPLKLYSYAGRPEDDEIAAIGTAANEEPEQTISYHGLLTVDYFSVLKTVRTAGGTWRALSSWTSVPFPLALVVYGHAKQ